MKLSFRKIINAIIFKYTLTSVLFFVAVGRNEFAYTLGAIKLGESSYDYYKDYQMHKRLSVASSRMDEFD